MAGSFEKSVKGGTKVKLAAPKSKYVDHILTATRAGESGVGEVFRTLDLRLRDSTWTIAFKALILVHLMIREGEPDATLSYLSANPRRLLPSSYADVQTQGRNIQNYSQYLVERAKSFRKAHFDYVRGGEARLKGLTVDKGLLRETESVQSQIRALLKCNLFADEVENEITITAFRLLTMDLLALFRVMNQGAINVLEHYFEMSKPDAERALEIYRTFAEQTNNVVRFLAVARQYEHSTKLEIPKIKHAPTSLANSLEEYLNDKDFEINRRQYLAQQEAKKSGKTGSSSRSAGAIQPASTKTAAAPKIINQVPNQMVQPQQSKAAPDLINFDFFESIEQNQQPMAQAPSQIQSQQYNPQTAFDYYQTQDGSRSLGAQPQANQLNSPLSGNSAPFGQIQQQQQPLSQPQNNFTGTGYGGYVASSPPTSWPPPSQPSTVLQNDTASPQYMAAQYGNQQFQQSQPQQTNPFRASVMPTLTAQPFSAFGNPVNQATGHSAKNPFARTDSLPAFSNQPSQTPYNPTSVSTPQSPINLQPQRTGTNPFARGPSPNVQAQGGQTQPTSVSTTQTGSTNPFRQSTFVNQQTGQGWQFNQGTMGGLESIPTIPVFPRPGQPQNQVQTQQQSWL